MRSPTRPPLGKRLARVFVVVLMVILVVILALSLAPRKAAAAPAGRPPTQGGAPASGQHLVVDALNLTHWARPGDPARPLATCDIIETIDETAPLLKELYPGRVMYVSKDRESALNDERVRVAYASAARRNGVHVYLVERYDPSAAPRPQYGRAEKKGRHSEQGRDDFLMGVLAWRFRCPVLSRDRFRDFAELKHAVGPFQAIEYAPHREFPEKQQYNPAAAEFSRVRRPRRVGPREVIPELALPGRG